MSLLCLFVSLFPLLSSLSSLCVSCPPSSVFFSLFSSIWLFSLLLSSPLLSLFSPFSLSPPRYEFPMRSLVQFMHNHGLMQLVSRPQWYVPVPLLSPSSFSLCPSLTPHSPLFRYLLLRFSALTRTPSSSSFLLLRLTGAQWLGDLVNTCTKF